MKYEYQVVHTALFSTPEDATAYVSAHKVAVGGMELKVAPYAAHIGINEYQKPETVAPVVISYTNIKP